MSFVYPGFLFALAAISIPIIIHLFHFRRFRKVFFSNVAFLEQLSDESKKQSRLKHLLVLASRILALAFLVMAFARPFIPVDDTLVSMEGNAVSVYIDNSFSMDALASQGRLIDQARERALIIADMYQPADQFQILTNDFEGRHQRFVTRDEFVTMVEEVGVTSTFRTIGEVIDRQSTLFQETTTAGKRAYLISDFQKTNTMLHEISLDTAVVTTFIPLAAQESENVYIDSCWFETPVHIINQTAVLTVRVVNDSDRSLSGQPIRLFVDDVQRTIATYDIGPGGTEEVQLSWTINQTGIQQGRVEIVDYPVTFDDQLYFSYVVNEEVPVLSVFEGRPSPFLGALFGSDTLFRYEQMPAFSIDYSRFPDFNFIIVNGLTNISPGLAFELQSFVEQGGYLLVFPGPVIDIDAYNDFLGSIGADLYTRADTATTRVSDLNDRHPVFTDVFEHIPEHIDLPRVDQHYVISRRLTSDSRHLMQMQNGLHFLSSQAVGRGQLFLSAVALEDAFSNFHRHALFVPTLVNMSLQSQSFQPLYHILGHNRPIQLRGFQMGGDAILHLRGEGIEVIPEQRRSGNQWLLYVHDQLSEAGNYSLYLGDEAVKGLSFNHDRRESQLEAYRAGELEAALRDEGLGHIQLLDSEGVDFDMALQTLRMGRQLWRHFLVLGLLFLLVVVALLRFWRSRR